MVGVPATGTVVAMPPPLPMARMAKGNRTRFQTWAAWSTATASVPRSSRGTPRKGLRTVAGLVDFLIREPRNSC